MTHDIAQQWHNAFLETVHQYDRTADLREASQQERLGDWTGMLTEVCVKTCQLLGWSASAIRFASDLLPVSRNEYLSLDVAAFQTNERRWKFPVAVMELENSRAPNLIAYSLWKMLCVRTSLRVLYCYRRSAEECSSLVRFLCDEVVHSMEIPQRAALEGETVIAVGSRNDADRFPYGFFKWWRLDPNIGDFRLM